jgi:outer membrane protein assembly factor BamB
MNRCGRWTAWFLAAGLVAATCAAADAPPTNAQALLDASGVRAGLAVLIGRDAACAGELASQSRLYVQAVAPDDRTALAWQRALDAGPARAQVSVATHGVNPLPYARDVVNLLVIGGEPNCPPAAEIARVLTPGGVAVVTGAPASLAAEAAKLKLEQGVSQVGLVLRKAPLPPGEDWGNAAGGPELGNSLPDSTIVPTMTLRWRAGPRWQARDYHVDAFACGSGVLLYRQIAVVPGSTELFLQHLIARDAYNGRELWRFVGDPIKRPMYGFTGAFDHTVAVGEGRICIGRNGKMVCLDAASGKELFAVDTGKSLPRTAAIYRKYLVFGNEGALAVHALEDGRKLWGKAGKGRMVGAIKGEMIFCPSGSSILACRLDTGAEAWSFDTAKDEHAEIPYRGGVYCTAAGVHYTKANKDQTFVFALDQQSGKPLWCTAVDNPLTVYPGAKDMEPSLNLIAFNDEIWYKFKRGAPRPKTGYIGTFTCLDAASGKVKQKNVTQDNESTHCWTSKGAGDYLFYSRNLFLNRHTLETEVNGLVRSMCAIGHIPAERQLFFLPHNCRCATLIRGVLAMGAPERTYDFAQLAPPTPVTLGGTYAAQTDAPADWPLFRGNLQRGSCSRTDPGDGLKKKWETAVGGAGLTQAVSAYGMVFLSDSEGQRVVALDAESGAQKWAFPAGARVSYPPSLYKGVCLFTTAAGWVWALDAKSGAPLWKLRAAPEDCYLGGQDRFESRWPAVGDVLVQNGVGYVSAGRAGTIDGGVHVVAFDPLTGVVAWNKVFRGTVSADLLVGMPDGKRFLMNAHVLDPAAHTLATLSSEPPGCLNLVLYSIGGLGTYTALDDYLASTERNQICMRRELLGDGKAMGINAAFSEKHSIGTANVPHKELSSILAPEQKLVSFEGKKKIAWEQPAAGLRVDGLVVGPEKLCWVGGSPTDDPKGESTLQVWSLADGKCLQSVALPDRPVPEGLSMAGGKLFVVTRGGKVVCY